MVAGNTDARSQARRLFGRIDPEAVDATLATLSTAWYVLAALQSLVIGIQILGGAQPSADLMDPVLCVVGGYFLRRRKSRVLAVLLFVYALLVLAVTTAALIGVTPGGRNIALAGVMVVVGWRGIRATIIYARENRLRLRWLRVLAVSGAALLAAAVFFAVASILVVSIFPDMNEDSAGLLIVAPALFSYLVTVGTLSMAFPFEAPDAPAPSIS